MSVEIYDGAFEQRQEHDLYPHQALAELIVSNHEARRALSDFMWDYVGHPDPQERSRGEYPGITRKRHEPNWDCHNPHARAEDGCDNVTYTQEVFSGFSDEGDLVHVRTVPGMHHDPRGYFVARGSLDGMDESRVHNVYATGGIQPNYVSLHLLDSKGYENWPQGFYPPMFARPADQLRVEWDTRASSQKFLLHDGTRRHATLYPIEDLLDTVCCIEQERRALGARGVVLAFPQEAIS